MSKIGVLLSGVAIAAITASSVLAADLPRRTAPPVAPYIVPIFTWTGFYLGLNAGAAFNDSRTQNSAFFNGYNQNGTSFTGGGQAGYNYQMGQFVLGLETDINYLGKTTNNNNSFGSYGNNNNRDGYFGTVRGRIGFALDRALFYGTGGLAYGRTNMQSAFVGPDAFGTPRAFYSYNNNNDRTKIGYAVGGGIEYALTNNWSIKGEYLYVDLGRSNNAYFDAGTGLSFTSNAQNRNHIARAGVNYRF